VSSVSRIDKTIELFCKITLETRLYSAKKTSNLRSSAQENCNLIDPTSRSHPMSRENYKFYPVNITWKSQIQSCEYHTKTTNSVIWTSRQNHILCYQNITWKSQILIIWTSRENHKFYHQNITWESKIRSSESRENHKFYHLNTTNAVVYISLTLSLKNTNSIISTSHENHKF